MTVTGCASRVELSPLGFLDRAAEALAARPAVVHGERRVDYGQFAGRCRRLGSALRGRGVGRGDRVAVLAPNTPALLESHFGVPLAGGVLVALNTRLGPSEIEFIVRDSGARLLLVDERLRGAVPERGIDGVETVVIRDSGEPDDPYEQLLARGDPADPGRRPEHEEEPISINYTSGTTGAPKGVVYTHRGAYLRALGVALEIGLGYESVHLWTLPMFHCNGWCLTWAVTAVGGVHVCLPKVEPGRVWELLERERVTHYSGAPTVHISVVGDPAARRLEQSVTVPTGGSPPSPALLRRMHELNLHPIHLYGLTETYGPAMACSWQPQWDRLDAADQAQRLARQGHTYTGSDLVRVLDDGGHDVPRDGETLGEVVMRGNGVTPGYHERPEETAAAMRDGWFHSGDLAVWHPDGYVELRDRAKDIIISGGENVSSIEVEQALSEHPAVQEVAVVATPDEHWGERPKAFVELSPGHEVGEAELIAFCRERLAGFKAPAHVAFEPLPRTATGKVQKFVLREREWHDRPRAIG